MSTYEQYRLLRRQIGYPEENAIAEHVWNGCEPASQENMLAQLQPVAQQMVEREARYGVVW